MLTPIIQESKAYFQVNVWTESKIIDYNQAKARYLSHWLLIIERNSGLVWPWNKYIKKELNAHRNKT